MDGHRACSCVRDRLQRDAELHGRDRAVLEADRDLLGNGPVHGLGRSRHWLHPAQGPQTTFAFIKPTIINVLFAVTILGSLAIGRNIWKTAFEHAFQMPDHAWKIFALRWAAFYIVLAILNEVLWRNFSKEFWVNSKLFLSIPLAIAFMAINLPFLMKHNIEQPEGADGDKKAGDAA
ncbi:MAG: hypothetical protein EON61_04275 [Alphaproteobacteria bacterium]|nr:MAG: hypothetical protein EON61_04275 [Alphaproteobacteria bacterium]